jgi:hypothetical protein
MQVENDYDKEVYYGDLWPKEANEALDLGCVTFVKPKIVRKEIAQLIHHPMIIENFRSSGVIFGHEIGRSIRLSAWRSRSDADASQRCCPIVRQPLVSSDKIKLRHVDITKIYACV